MKRTKMNEPDDAIGMVYSSRIKYKKGARTGQVGIKPTIRI
jgi:hypothetical protein